MANKRLEMLEKMVEAGQADAFARYALALEYRKLERYADALSTFEALRDAAPDYLPMYLMAGQLLVEDLADAEAARPWLEQGIALAEEQGDPKALSELSDALADLD